LIKFKSRFRHYGRYKQIVAVLIRHGFGDLVGRMKVQPLVRIGRQAMRRDAAKFEGLSYAKRIRLAMEELGPSFIKLGQVLSNRPFLIPAELTIELSKLQDEVAPCGFESIRETIEDEFKKPLSSLFKEFSEEPVASASLAQVHLAVTNSGDNVAVKVLRPGVRKMLAVDMEILKEVATLLEKHVPESGRYKPVEQADELARVVRREVDLYFEARSIEIFKRNFEGDPDICIPDVNWDLCSSRVLTTSIVDGIKVSRVDELREAGYDLTLLAKRGARIVFRMIFEHHFFHADPHPGNLFVVPENRWAPVDFGQVGTLSETAIDLLADMLLVSNRMDGRGAVRVLASHDLLDDDVDTVALEAEFTDFLYIYHRTPLKQLNMRAIFEDALGVFTRYGIRIPSSLMMLGKAVGTYEEVARMLDPNVNLIKEAEPFAKKLAFRKFNAKRISSSAFSMMDGLYDLVTEAPHDMKRLSRRLLKGEMGLVLKHLGLDSLSTDIDRASNRLSFSMIIAALIVGSSWIMTSDTGLIVYGVPLLGVFGFLVAAALGLWLVISIIRSGRL
jgi:ubiquinone biosynthesis protein